MISNDRFQSGGYTSDVETNDSFNLENTITHLELKSNDASLVNRFNKGFAIFEKYLINHL